MRLHPAAPVTFILKGKPLVFVSFFPRPRLFFLSALFWTAAAMALWYAVGKDAGAVVGMPPLPPGTQPAANASVFWSGPFLWFDIYFAAAAGIFGAFWIVISPHPWALWSILGSALISGLDASIQGKSLPKLDRRFREDPLETPW